MVKKTSILGINIDMVDMRSAVNRINQFLDENNDSYLIFTANPHSLVISQKDSLFRDALNHADLLIPDGVLLVLASRVFYPQSGFPERVSGPDLFIEICKLANQKSLKYFFFGSTKEVLVRIKKKIINDYQNIRVVGYYDPPFGDLIEEENNKIIEMINQAKPDILWVGMTAPRQEKWIFQNKDHLDVKVIGAIGAAFDFYSGIKKRSPKWFRDHGLEWLPRLLREPKRLWRRTFVSAPVFLYLALKERLKKI